MSTLKIGEPSLVGRYSYVYVDGIYLCCSWGRVFENATISSSNRDI